VLGRARELGPLIRQHADEAETLRRMPDAVVEAMTAAGLFRLSVPPAFGGSQLELSDQLAVIEEVARHDASAGWCVMIHATTSVLSGQLEDSVLQEMFGADPKASACGVYAPRGRATTADGGYRVTGRWSFGSGCQHSRWRLGGALVFEDGKPKLDEHGSVQLRLAIFDADDTRIHDTWHVAGLRGTGSHDFEAEDVLVPHSRVVQPGQTPVRNGGLYRMPLFGFLAAEVAAVAIGIGRAAIDEFVALAGTKRPMGSKRSLAERGTIQLAIAEAEANVSSARAYLADVVGSCEAGVARGDALTLDDRARLRLAASHAVASSTRAVDRMYEAGGGTALYESSPLQRHFRDIHAATQHVMVAPGIRELVGRHLVGLAIDPAQL
jgi:alkylation response protein AidB-like acyl-CoA dehydrogenase